MYPSPPGAYTRRFATSKISASTRFGAARLAMCAPVSELSTMKPAGIARHDKKPVCGLIELRQRVLCGAIDRPSRHDPASGLIYHSQIVLVGDVDV